MVWVACLIFGEVSPQLIVDSSVVDQNIHTTILVTGDGVSWTDAMELTSCRGRLDTFEKTLQNPLTDDEDNNIVELDENTGGRVNPKKPVSASHFWIFQQHYLLIKFMDN